MAEADSTVSSTKYDLVVFGASGFTGQYVVREVARTVEEEKGGLTWAVAGRSMQKLQAALVQAGEKTGKNLQDIPIIIADVKVESTLLDMAKQARVVLNCVGPYRFYGDAVVRACIEGGAHHLDISGEPGYLEKNQLIYNGKAKEAGIYIIGTCGFDSIPSEMGIQFTKEKFEEKGDLNGIESYIFFKQGPSGAGINFGTWQSAIYGVAHEGDNKRQRKQIYPTPMPKPQHPISKRGLVHFSKDVNSWCLPFLGTDKSVAYRTQRYNFENNKQRPIQFYPYVRFASLFSIFIVSLYAIVFGILANFRCGRWLLEKFPGIFSAGYFSKSGPTEQQIEETSVSFTFVGTGYPSKVSFEEEHEDHPNARIVTRVSAPEPGYITTSTCLVQSAYVLLAEGSKLPPGGGVLTPGVAFPNTNMIKRLEDHGIKFSVVEQISS